MKAQTTDTLSHILDTLCKNEEDQTAINKSFHEALQKYQWHYQNSTDKQQDRNANRSASKAIQKVITLLKNVGQYTLANDIIDALGEPYNDFSTYTKRNVISVVVKDLKESVQRYKISNSRYKNIFATPLKEAFIEWCEKYPLKKAPEHFDFDFDPYSY